MIVSASIPSDRRARQALPLDWGFLRRTALATLVTSFLVALFGALNHSPVWGGRYLVFALWSIAFFACSAMIFKNLLFEKNRVGGMLWIAAKLFCLVALMVIPQVWPMDGPEFRAHAFAMFAGVTTPMAVLVLRVLGRLMEARGKNDGNLTPERGGARNHA